MSLSLGTALNPINSSVVATALFGIATEMGVPIAHTAILVSALYVGCAIAQPTAGRLAEVLGARRVLLGGVGLAVLGGLVGGLGTSFGQLVAARVLIGVGTATSFPAAVLLIHRRSAQLGGRVSAAHAFGYLSMTGSATLAFGPALGGVLVAGLGWRAAFLVNVPLGLIALLLISRWIPPDAPGQRAPLRTTLDRIDLPGVVGFTAAMAALIGALTSAGSPRWLAFACFALCTVGLVAWELRATTPFFDVRALAQNRSLTTAYLRYAIALLGTHIVLYGITQWMQVTRGLTPYQAGLTLLPMGLGSIVGSYVASHFLGSRLCAMLAMSALVLLTGAATSFLLHADGPIAIIAIVTSTAGFAAGSSVVANQVALYRVATPEALGTSAGLFRTFGYLGSIASAAVIGFAFQSGPTDQGLRTLSYSLVGVGVVALLLSAFLGGGDEEKG